MLSYDTQRFCDVQPRTALLQLGSFEYLHVEGTQLAPITDAKLIGSDSDQGAGTLAPARNGYSESVLVMMTETARNSIPTVRVATKGAQNDSGLLLERPASKQVTEL